MMSSSELQRISLSATRGIRADGHIDVEEIVEPSVIEEEEEDNEDDQKSDTKSVNNDETQSANEEPIVAAQNRENLTNGGGDVSPSKANVTITSSIGDITVDSVRDHLNSTVSTLHTTTTEEIVGM